MGLLLQLDESSGSAPGEHDAQQALRKAQAS
jgi:hypothetical protein